MKWPTFRDLFIGITIPISETGYVKENEDKVRSVDSGRDDDSRLKRSKDAGFLESREIITGGEKHGNTGEAKRTGTG